MSGSFMNLLSDIHMAVVRGQTIPPVINPLVYVHQVIWNLATIVLRLTWQHDLRREGPPSDDQWMLFAQTDIDHFHVEFRSLVDYLAQAIVNLANQVGVVPSESFRRLRNWARESEGNKKRLGKDLAALVIGCEWFDDRRLIRDSIVHQGGFTIVFPVEDRILFQVHQGSRRLVRVPNPLMWNENVVDFALYAGHTVAQLLDYLERAAVVLRQRMIMDIVPSGTASYHPGCSLF